LLNIMSMDYPHPKLNFSPTPKATERRDLTKALPDASMAEIQISARAACKYKDFGWGHDSATPHAQATGGVAEEPVSAKVARMLADAGLTLAKPTQLENMVIAINRLEGAQQDEINRGLALLVREAKLTHREALLLAIAYSRQR
jgi:hypothetical protein